MKITSNNNIIGGVGYDLTKKPKISADEKIAGKFDRVSIGTHTQSDGAFIDKLRAQISAEVKAGAGDKKISDIQKEIALGKYDVNAAETARLILGL